ncbi:MAG: RNA polymerase factor sigma-54 [Pyrinomonadaceae bacterium]|nr:RNA polymerase factor sigma-54 [Pyrinomonadaceae bacterium]
MSSLRLTQKLQQKMVLTPQLRQRIEMLQMTTLELSELIQAELNENPILEEVESGDEILELAEKILDQNADGTEREFDSADSPDAVADKEGKVDATENGHVEDLPDTTKDAIENSVSEGEDAEGKKEDDGSDSFDEVDLGREFQDYLDPGYRTQEFEYKEDAPSFDQFLSSSETLIDHLTWQLNLQQIDEKTELAGECIIGNLDEYGRLAATVEEVAEMCSVPDHVVEQARQVVLKLDPIGCGAVDIRDCLLAQLEANGEGESLAARLVAEHLEDMQPHRLQHLSKKTGVSVEELDEEIEKVRVLNPYPGKEYTSEAPIYVSPEVYIEKVEGEYVIYFSDNGSPRLRISHTYQSLMGKDDTNKETKDFIKGKVRSAVDLLRNIEHRRQTIYRVVECIVKRQMAFLDHGVEQIKPMMLKDVAEDIGMHLSTVSRVVNRKYAHTPQGVIELRRFFSEGMLNEDGEEVSTRILKLKIKRMIEDEDSKKPLTDDKIAKILGRDGVKLSRRTVAKYRDQMNIPGSRERKTVV